MYIQELSELKLLPCARRSSLSVKWSYNNCECCGGVWLELDCGRGSSWFWFGSQAWLQMESVAALPPALLLSAGSNPRRTPGT